MDGGGGLQGGGRNSDRRQASRRRPAPLSLSRALPLSLTRVPKWRRSRGGGFKALSDKIFYPIFRRTVTSNGTSDRIFCQAEYIFFKRVYYFLTRSGQCWPEFRWNSDGLVGFCQRFWWNICMLEPVASVYFPGLSVTMSAGLCDGLFFSRHFPLEKTKFLVVYLSSASLEGPQI